MAQRPLATPRIPTPLPLVDPYRDRLAYIRVLSEIYHAEAAALAWFELLDAPSVVRDAEIFKNAKAMLVRDEASHMKDLEEMIRLLGGDGVLPPCPASASFWHLADPRDAGKWGGTLPLKPSTVALFMLFSE